ncbi:hypothetical protein EPN83_02895 [Patescibacteria group bacterium]|nr:MAG: hypothetical protein EPN83_02895 [Patescibacteria group bacterium]
MQFFRKKTYNLLRWSEQFTKTDMVYATKGGFWLTLNQFFYSLFAFLLAIAFANLVSKENFGNYKYILSLASIIGAFSLTGLGNAVMQSVARNFEGILRKSFWMSLRWSLPATAISLVGAFYYLANGNPVLGLSLVAVGLLTPILNSASLYLSFLNGKRDFRRISLYGALKAGFTSVLIFAILILTDRVLPIVLAYFASHTAITLFLYWRTLKVHRPNDNFEQKSISYGKHLSLINILGIIGDKVDSVLLFHFLGGAPLAVYAFATAVPNQVIALFRNIGLLTIPKFAQRDIPSVKKEIHNKSLRLLFVLALTTVAYWLAAKFLYQLFFPQYLESVGFSRFYSLILPISASIFYTSYLEAYMAIKEKYIMVGISNIVRIALMAALVVPFGIVGIISAQIITKLCMATISIFLVNRHGEGTQVTGT